MSSRPGSNRKRSYRKQDQILVEQVLEERLEDDELLFFKACRLQNDLNLTTRAIGKHMSQIRDDNNQFEVEDWGADGSASTWRVEPADD